MTFFIIKDLRDLKMAKTLLENPGIAAKLTSLLAVPIEQGFKLLPAKWNAKITELTRTALTKAVQAAIFTLDQKSDQAAANTWHKVAVATSGGVGGFFGLPALALELPISTTIMLRSIADIARSEGEPIDEIKSQMACIEVLALGGVSQSDDAAKSGYFALRAILARSLPRAAEYITGKGLAKETAPAVARLIAKIAERFSIQVSEKVAAQAIPAVGAAGGALVNTLFLNHFQEMARGHFIIRRLERRYGKRIVRWVYRMVKV